jgi:four helix bundle suffix protein
MDEHGRTETEKTLIPKHGGYRKLKTFQLASLIYDVTVRFCDRFVDRRSRTRDQMVQAARSGRQNIAEGSVDSATSKKMEMKLTGVAKGSLEELRLDYEDFLRQRGLPLWPPDHPALLRFKALRCATLEAFRRWVAEEARRWEKHGGEDTDEHGRTQTNDHNDAAGPCRSVSSVPPHQLGAVLAANGALSLLNLCIFLLDRQLKSQADRFESTGGAPSSVPKGTTDKARAHNSNKRHTTPREVIRDKISVYRLDVLRDFGPVFKHGLPWFSGVVPGGWKGCRTSGVFGGRKLLGTNCLERWPSG